MPVHSFFTAGPEAGLAVPYGVYDLTVDELAALAQQLAPAQEAQAAQRRFEQRGGQRRRAPGAGSTGLLSAADRVLVTVVYLGQICSQNVLSDLLGINTNSIGQAIAETASYSPTTAARSRRPRCGSPPPAR